MMTQIQPYLYEIDELLGQIDSVSASAEGLNDPEFTHKLRRWHSRMALARREFDATLFVVVCFGMLKSGKSTLINLLAHHRGASPMGYGRDTTQRPSLIVKGENSSIRQYYSIGEPPTESSGLRDRDRDRDAFDSVVSYIRGSLTRQELDARKDPRIQEREIPLTSENLYGALCSSNPGTPREPFITVVTTPGSPLLDQHVALLDVPGLDSAISEWPKSGWYQWLLERCDFLIFLQSTVSALNLDAEKVLAELNEKSKQPPVWLVHNLVEARSWLPKETLEQEGHAQAKDARKQVGSALGRRDLPQTITNLGKAYSGRFPNGNETPSADELLGQSNIMGLEDDLLTTLTNQRFSIQAKNSADAFRDRLKETEKDLGAARQELLDRRKTLRAREQFYGKAIEQIEAMSYDYALHHLRHVLKDVLLEAQAGWEKWIAQEHEAFSNQLNGRFEGSFINQAFSEHLTKCCDQGSKLCFHGSNDLIRKIERKASEQFSEAEAAALQPVWLGSDEVPLVPHFESWSLADKPFCAPAKPAHIPFDEHKWLLFKARFDANETRAERQRVVTSIDKYVRDLVADYSRTLFDTIFPNYAAERKRQVVEQLGRRKKLEQQKADAAEERLDSKLAALDSVDKLMGNVGGQIQRLAHFLQ